MRRLLIALLLALPVSIAARAEEPVPAKPINIGMSLALKTHGAQRNVNVILPRGYDAGEKTYPIVVVLDGGAGQDLFLAVGIQRWNELWSRSQEAIVVGVETVDRQRELLPPTQDLSERERYPSAGESREFRQWLAKIVTPLIRSNYRHDGRAFLIGESAAGHFVAETWVNAPWLFNGYAALSPSFQWDQQSLSRRFAAESKAERPPIFVSLANEGGQTEEGALRFIGAAGPNACFADRRDSHVRHSDSLHQLLPEALQFLLPTNADWLEEFGMIVTCASGKPD